MSTSTTPNGTARQLLYLLALLGTLLPALPVSAWCTPNPALSTHENNAVPIPFGRVNLQNEALQPFGSLLASVAVLPTYRNLPPETVLWSCDERDIERADLHFLAATNGNLGDIGGAEGLTNISATWFTEYAHVGLRQRIGEVELSRFWKRVELRAFHHDVAAGKIRIRIRDLPTLSADLYKVSQTPKFKDTKYFCGGLGLPMADALYICQLPSSYIQFAGPGLQHDHAGADSHQHRIGINADNGFGYRMFNAMTLAQKPSCAVLSAPSVVRFPEVSVSAMERGEVLTVPLSMVFRCSMSAVSGTGKGNTAIALQASPGGFAAARELALVTADGGARFLLSDHYGRDPQIATGVGIALAAAGSGRSRRFADPANPGVNMGGQSGWYPFMRDGQQLPDPSKRDIELKLEARLQRLTGHPVTPGKIHATARIVIKVP